MDPIHPIAPLPPNLPPVAPAPMIGRIDRDSPRRNPEQERRRRPGQNPAVTESDEPGRALEQRDGDDDSGLHINVTA